jgi:hypothetical protein
MRQTFFILPKEGERLPTSNELRAAGFVVSSAMAPDKKTSEQEQEELAEKKTHLPVPRRRDKGVRL